MKSCSVTLTQVCSCWCSPDLERFWYLSASYHLLWNYLGNAVWVLSSLFKGIHVLTHFIQGLPGTGRSLIACWGNGCAQKLTHLLRSALLPAGGVSSLKAMSVTAMSSALVVTYGCSYPQRSHRPKLCDLKDWPDLGLLSGTVPLGLPTALSSGAKCFPPLPAPGLRGCVVGAEQTGAQQLSIREWAPGAHEVSSETEKKNA